MPIVCLANTEKDLYYVMSQRTSSVKLCHYHDRREMTKCIYESIGPKAIYYRQAGLHHYMAV